MIFRLLSWEDIPRQCDNALWGEREYKKASKLKNIAFGKKNLPDNSEKKKLLKIAERRKKN